MSISVEFHTGLRHQVQMNRLSVEISGALSIRALLEHLFAQQPLVAKALVESDGVVDYGLLVIIDDDVVPRSEWETTLIADNEIIELHIAMVDG